MCIIFTHFAASMMTISPHFPTSSDPYSSERPRAAAALMVAAERASGIVMWRLTHARCITSGCVCVCAGINIWQMGKLKLYVQFI